MIAIIGGSGVYDPHMLQNVRDISVDTEFGTIALKSGNHQGKSVYFLARHGSTHSVPPHLVNYRGNIRALQQLKVERIISTSAVGSLRKEMNPGDLVLLDQFIDFTKNRHYTFFDDKVVHTDVTNPYCSQLRAIICQAAKDIDIPLHPGGTYICTEGPRFETPAEINMFSLMGGHVVGMTNVPEVVLARETKICYASIAAVTNYAAGISPTRITHQEVIDIMDKNSEMIKKLIAKIIEMIPQTKTCECGD
ncbi:MAG: S-methyl-5'-thioadenosine phosphorylase [Theionarchaea archaeon]|nr:S-methyl-5'-thioadenosine phosphorylase [Theionarchaea archaeon]MBU7001466.1 S-methyl-5'-thioadenosine phosphorylase [Theionarchaea archaeon]MBU7035108.1 S-methyl-5'-thioadenosine phosphorylase [Theionarchaea archaeon]MBU7040242.1 S-methyl-5'-thioadenosine phosphorylase [Theionarchaea archaeon]